MHYLYRSQTGGAQFYTMSLFEGVPAFKESRFPSLYSDFEHLREINPEGYEANIQAWADLFMEGLKLHTFGSTITIPSSMAAELHLAKYGDPLSLHLVLNEQVKLKRYIPWSIYKDSSPQAGLKLGDYISPFKLLQLTWGKVRLSSFTLAGKNGQLAPDHYIPWAHLVSVGDRIAGELQRKIDSDGHYLSRLFDDEEFSTMIRGLDANMSDSDIQVLLLYLSRDTGRMTVVRQSSESQKAYIKFGTGSAELTEEDIGTIKLKASIASITKRTVILEHRLDEEIPSRIQALLKTSNDQRLKNVLIQKTHITKSLTKSTALLNQLQIIMDNINEAHSNLAVYNSLQSAKSVLKSLNEKVSFADIDKLRMELDEEIATVNEISETMVVERDVDEDAIDQELADLEKEYKKSQEEKDAAITTEDEKSTTKKAATESVASTAIHSDVDQLTSELAAQLKDVRLEDPEDREPILA